MINNERLPTSTTTPQKVIQLPFIKLIKLK